MKKTSAKIFIALTALVIPVFIFAMPHFAQASCVPLPGESFSFTDCILLGTSWMSQLAFQISGAFLTLAGILLNGTMVATLNISQIVNATPAIGVAWRTIRDFSSIFIIFLLLYASIKMILGLKDNNLSTLIKNIIIAGLLINFSLFFTKFAIDASNIASLSFYNAITPGQNISSISSISGAFSSAGLSDVFMQSLDITKVVASGGGNSGTLNDRNITLANVGDSVLMITAAFSFIFAAVAFAVRIGILILLMAFSPIYFIGMVLPKTQEYSQKWLKILLSMCLFMPVYLLLMYVAMSVINDPNFFNFAKVTSIGTTGATNSLISAPTVGIVLQYIIAYLFINAPLVAAIKIGSEGTDIAVKWGQAAKNWSQGFIGQHTVGRASKAISDSETFGKLARMSPTIATTIDKNILSKGSSATFGGSKGGYDARFKKYSEARSKLAGKVVSSASPEEYRAETEVRRADLQEKQRQLDEALAVDINSPSMTLDERNRAIEKTRVAQEARDKAQAEFAARKTDEKDIKGELNKQAKEEYAKNLEGGTLTNIALFMTKKARKDAADKVRKEMKKGKKDKAIDDLIAGIKEESKGSDEGGGSAEKGDKDKAKK